MSWMLDREIKRSLPEEWKGIVPTEVFIREAERIVEEATKRKLVMRIIGGLGIAIHCRENREFALALGRVGAETEPGQEYSDIDLMSYRKDRDKIKILFGDMAYAKRRATLSSAASERQIYYHPDGWFAVDVFFDKLLVANHPVDFRGRLEMDYPTITVTDFLLEKIQMWEAFGAKDLKDCLLLLKTHEVTDRPGEDSIDSAYMARVLAEDWGFWYTATTQLRKILKFVSELDKYGSQAGIRPEAISADDRQMIGQKVETILKAAEDAPKSLGWRMRAKVGTKKRWYEPVERPETVGGFGIWEAIGK